MLLGRLLIAALLGATPAASANAQKAPQGPNAMDRALACRSLAEQSARLACYDREVAALASARERKDLVVLDRSQMRETRRSVFGLTIPRLAIFGGDEDGDGVDRLETTITRVRQNPYGKWLLTVKEGSVWMQIDSRELSFPPVVGDRIVIRRAALGSFLANVRGQSAIRLKRIT